MQVLPQLFKLNYFSGAVGKIIIKNLIEHNVIGIGAERIINLKTK